MSSKDNKELIELKSNEFSLVYTSYIESLHKEQESDFCDVTLVSDDDITFQAHKILLSSHSTFFRSILKQHVHAHPLIYLHGINSSHLGFILDYIYKGKVQLYEDQLKDFLDAAEKLKIKNLTKNIVEDEIKENKATDSSFEIVSDLLTGKILKIVHTIFLLFFDLDS